MTVNHLYPTTRPTLDLNFARQKRLDPRVTFTRGSTATYVGDDGLIKTAASNEARFDHDPVTGESLGLLVEESRTNLATYSEQFNSWPTVQAITVTANAETAPDGTMTADRISQSASTNATRYLANSSISYSSQTVTMSVWARKVSGTDSGGRFGFAYVGDGGIRQYIDPTSTWQRYTYTRTLGSSGSANIGIVSEWDINGAANNNVYALWGFQAEVGSFPTSYIPTTSSTVTRSADVASMTGTNFSSWYNQSEGSILAVARIGDLSTANQSIASAEETASTVQFNAVGYRVGGGGSGYIGAWSYNASGQAFFNINAGITSNTEFKAVHSYKTNDYAASVNGSVPVTDTVGNVSTVIDRLRIGSYVYGSVVTGTIARITYYPTRLIDSQLQELTR